MQMIGRTRSGTIDGHLLCHLLGLIAFDAHFLVSFSGSDCLFFAASQQLECCPEDGFDTLEASICVNRRDSDDSDSDFDEDDYESDGEPDPNAWTDKPRTGIARAVAKSKAQPAKEISGGSNSDDETTNASFHQTMSFTIPRASLDASLSGSEAGEDVSFTLDANALAGL